MSVDRRVFDINFFGPVSLSKLVIKQFLQQGKGHIVVVSSIDGKFGKLIEIKVVLIEVLSNNTRTQLE